MGKLYISVKMKPLNTELLRLMILVLSKKREQALPRQFPPNQNQPTSIKWILYFYNFPDNILECSDIDF